MTTETPLQEQIAQLKSKAGNDAEAGLQLSRLLMHDGQIEESFETLVKAAQAGHPVAATELGLRLVSGAAGPFDPAAGNKWIEAAAKARFPEAMRWLALLSATGNGRTQSFGEALTLLAAAAQAGDSFSAKQLGVITSSGINSDESLEAFLNPPKPDVRSEAPRIISMENFLPRDICRWFANRALPKLERANTYDPETGGRGQNEMRTNSGRGFPFLESDVVIELTRARIAAAIGLPVAWQEGPNVLHYKAGEQYEPHYDFLNPEEPLLHEDLNRRGQRIVTALVYLNDDFTGGETGFEELGTAIRMPAGGLLSFENVRDGQPDKQTLHSGRPPLTGEKWLLSIWVRDQEQPIA